MADRGTDADNGPPDRSWGRSLPRPGGLRGEADATPDRVFARKELRGELLVHNRGFRSGRAVGLREGAPSPQLHADRVEKPWTDGNDADFGRALFGFPRGAAVDLESAAIAAERRHARRQ